MIQRRSKYGNKKTVRAGIKFDSKREADRYTQLQMLEKSGAIDSLTLQPKFTLIESQRNEDGKAERPVVYIGDFMYRQGGKWIVEDAKGMKTPDYVIKRKLMLERHGITIREV